VDEHAIGLLRLLVAELHTVVVLTLSVQVYGKPFLALTDVERADIEQKAANMRLPYTSQLTEEGVRKLLETVLPPDSGQVH
jgi:hypothetical protein